MTETGTSPTVADVVIVGSGAAGLTLAIELARTAKPPSQVVCTKANVSESSTNYAQGGIAAALSSRDSYDSHIRDTIAAADGLCDEHAVHTMVVEAPARIRDLLRMGVPFERTAEGQLSLAREGGHSLARVLHVGDSTGKAIERVLIEHARSSPNLKLLADGFVVDLIVRDGRCVGVWILDRELQPTPIFASTVVFATGGVGHLFERTTNPDVSTGDGVAMAIRAGAECTDLEFIQFHPTAFCSRDAPAFLLTEALRGEGAVLRDAKGNRIMENEHPLEDLAPRDIVSRTIFFRLREDSSECVFLDISHRSGEELQHRFPMLYDRCMSEGINMAKQAIPVAPAAHYLCGGISTDLDGKTSLAGLYAVGETARTGVHGANRLASNSLLESVVFAYRAAVSIESSLIHGRTSDEAPSVSDAPPRSDSILSVAGSKAPSPEFETAIHKARQRLRSCIWENVGIVRSRSGLNTAADEVEQINNQFLAIQNDYMLTQSSTELLNMIRVSKHIIAAAGDRSSNVGTHFNLDLAGDHASPQEAVGITRGVTT